MGNQFVKVNIFHLIDVYVCFVFHAVEETSLRVFFRHIDLNANDELDAYELQHYFHDIEPDDNVPDLNHVIHTMKRVANEHQQHFSISWQQFHDNFIDLDSLADNNIPQVRRLFFYFRIH